MAVQHSRQIFSCIRAGQLRNRLRRSDSDNLAATTTTLWAEIDDPIRRLDDFEVVLDDHNRAPYINQTAKGSQKFADVIEMQSGRRLVEDVEQPPFQLFSAACSPCRLLSGRLQVRRQLHPLRLAAR